VEDVLARRTRALILNARAALAIAPAIADMIAPELNWNEATKELQVSSFQKVAANYILR
jgi:glycerol-3-phosphate dehydrogenase